MNREQIAKLTAGDEVGAYRRGVDGNIYTVSRVENVSRFGHITVKGGIQFAKNGIERLRGKWDSKWVLCEASEARSKIAEITRRCAMADYAKSVAEMLDHRAIASGTATLTKATATALRALASRIEKDDWTEEPA